MGAIPASAVVTITEHSVPGRAQGIATGPDGNVWFTQPQDVQIGRNSTPVGIAAGADGNLWFTEYNSHKIGKITPAGAITEYPVPTAGSRPDQVTTGPDGKMWFTHVSTNKIGKATTSSFVDEVSETVQLARTSRRFFDPPDRDQAVEDVDDELGRGAWLRTRLVSRRSAPCAYQVTDAQRWLGPPVSRCLR
ncbi:hypothetical protein [Streptomyces sp. Ag109_G2-15]|uniref:Vgb family protein n=1 Tax=Streptomyces sp. Ag109_G2-15 TaxID=1938850 RepID=UPI000BC42039|nr:hypothetical protein [Streptomyces sp. Ag109_G2-15]SOE06506.1 hypothetical protein SAMN06272765_7326 [Streptomyces sp. Ag109_G2-15]